MTTSIDHLMTITPDLEAAAAAAARLGFLCAPLSEHKGIGTANRNIVFADDYWELLGITSETPTNAPLRQSLASRSGIHGICASSSDMAEELAWARHHGLPMTDPLEISRQLGLGDVGNEARFVLSYSVRSPDGLVLFRCKHLTRDLVLDKNRQSHPNGALGLGSIALHSEQCDELSRDLEALFGAVSVKSPDEGYLIDVNRHVIRVESVDQSQDVARLLGSRVSGYSVIAVRCRDPELAIRYAADHGVRTMRTQGGRRLAHAPEFGALVVEFVAEA